MDHEALIQPLPDSPGCYLFISAEGEILYVGKARSLVKRVRSHFHRKPPAEFIDRTARVDYVATANEVEALLLEYNLIQQHRPRHNVRLKDDKKYPWIKITWQERWPRVYLTRTVRRDGGKYFGPFPNVKPARAALQMIREIFPVRSCRYPSEQLAFERACIDYEMKRCVAPCIGAVSEEDYRALFSGIELMLRGQIEPVKRDLRRRMQAASDAQAYERAAFYRDAIANLEALHKRQTISLQNESDSDCIGYGRFGDTVCCALLRRRQGKIEGSECYTLDAGAGATVGEALAAFILQFYSMTSFLPRDIYCAEPPDEHEALEQWLSERAGHRVTISAPQRGDKRRSVSMATQNAELQAAERYRRLHGIGARVEPALDALARVLGLAAPPLRMECFDISTLQGTHTVASMAVFWCGRPDKRSYRRFRVRGVDGPDDFASMRQVLLRRFAHNEDDEKFGHMPDLVVIDGGRGQLHAAQAAMAEAGHDGLPVISLAKREELIFHPDSQRPIVLPLNDPALALLRRLRDEAHRFAVAYHRQLRGAALRTSALDAVPGLGPSRKRNLLRALGSLEAVAAADAATLAGVPGISRQLAERIVAHFHAAP